MPDPQGLQILFAGTPEFAARHLDALTSSRHRVLAVYTQPDRPAGRGKKLHPTPVKQLALAANLPVLQPASLKHGPAQAELAGFGADLLVVVAYGLLLPKAVLQAPRLGCINVHASLLPRWRGAAPIQRAIEAGDRETGITIMQMDEGLDTGPMLLKRSCAITATDCAGDLHDRLAALGPSALLDALEQIVTGTAQAEPQDDALATYAPKLNKIEAELDWQLPAAQLALRVRAFNPFPMAYTQVGEENWRVLQAQVDPHPQRAAPGTLVATDGDLLVACGQQSSLRLQVLQRPGKTPVPAKDLINGLGSWLKPGLLLGRR